jgi:hypothetical protein
MEQQEQKEITKNSDPESLARGLDVDPMMSPAPNISHVEQGEAKKSQPTVRDNVLAFCIVFCQLVQVRQLFYICS